MSTTSGIGSCLSEDEVFSYVRRAADAPSDATVQRHVDECEVCRVLIGEAARLLAQSSTDDDQDRTGAARTLCVGERIGERYEITRFVARGGMGEVYEARDTVLNETVALKTLVCTALDNPRAVSRLLAEVKLARQVTHPNVCRILEFGVHRPNRGYTNGESVPFLTMEFLAGETLDRKIVREGRLNQRFVKQLLPQIIAGLRAIHDAGIVHRDIKPHNMMFVAGAAERLVLTDFGLARALELPNNGLSGTGPLAVGTLDYMAPEQLEGKPPTPSFDVYALGIVIFEMLTGQKPFRAESAFATAMERFRRPPPLPSEFVPDLDPIWDAIVSRCLALDPADRFQSVDELLRADIASNAASGERSATAATALSVAPPSNAKAARFAVWVSAAAVLLLSLLIAGAPKPRLLNASSNAGKSMTTGLAASMAGPVTLQKKALPDLPHKPARPVQREFTNSGCSKDMVRVADRFCIDRYEASTVDAAEERDLSPYYPPAVQSMREIFAEFSERVTKPPSTTKLPLPLPAPFQLAESWEARAVSRKAVAPQGYVSQRAALAACQSAGKRLCTEDEWVTACKAEKGTQFPYGASYRPHACNVYRSEHPGLILHGDFTTGLLDPRMNQVHAGTQPLMRVTGATPSCKSQWGSDAIYDMVGNLDEWTADPDGTFVGGFYSRPTRDGCDAKIVKYGVDHFNYSTGFRCCDNLR